MGPDTADDCDVTELLGCVDDLSRFVISGVTVLDDTPKRTSFVGFSAKNSVEGWTKRLIPSEIWCHAETVCR